MGEDGDEDRAEPCSVPGCCGEEGRREAWGGAGRGEEEEGGEEAPRGTALLAALYQQGRR